MSKMIEISRDIAASPELAYAAISDVTRMGKWSEECHACEWHEGFDGPVVGATFDGHNRNGEHEWTTQGKVIGTVRNGVCVLRPAEIVYETPKKPSFTSLKMVWRFSATTLSQENLLIMGK